MYVTFSLLILEKQAFFENSLFTLPRQPIKLRESDKSLITVENYSINISVKINSIIPYETAGIFLPFRTWGRGPLTLGKNSAQIYHIGSLKKYVNILVFLLPVQQLISSFFVVNLI